MKIDIRAIIKELYYLGEKSCLFVVGVDRTELLCTITSQKMYLAPLVREGAFVHLKGSLNIWRRLKNGRQLIRNTLYVDELETLDNDWGVDYWQPEAEVLSDWQLEGDEN